MHRDAHYVALSKRSQQTGHLGSAHTGSAFYRIEITASLDARDGDITVDLWNPRTLWTAARMGRNPGG